MLDDLVVFTWLRSNRMLIALIKNTARLFTRAAARMNFHDCMIFSNLHAFLKCRHLSCMSCSLRTRLLLYGGLYGGPEWPVFARVPLAAE